MYFATDWTRRVDFDSMRLKRLDQMRKAMAAHDLDAIIAFEYANTRYIAGLRPLWAPNFLLRQAALITRYSEDVICLVHQDDTPHRQSTMYWLKPEHIREFPTAVVNEQAPPSALEPIRQGLEELGFSSGRLGVDIATVGAIQNLQNLFPEAQIVDVAPCMRDVRMVKNAATIKSFLASVMSLREGIRQCASLTAIPNTSVRRALWRPG